MYPQRQCGWIDFSFFDNLALSNSCLIILFQMAMQSDAMHRTEYFIWGELQCNSTRYTGSFVLHLPIFHLLGFWWDDHSRPQMCWDRSQQLPSQTPTIHPSQFFWLNSFSVPKTNVASLQRYMCWEYKFVLNTTIWGIYAANNFESIYVSWIFMLVLDTHHLEWLLERSGVGLGNIYF